MRKRGTCGDPVIHEDDDAVGERRQPATLSVKFLSAGDLLLLCLCQIFDFFTRKIIGGDRVRVHMDRACLTHCTQRIFGIVRCSELSSDEDVQWKMQPQAQLITDSHPTSRKCQNNGCRIATVLDQSLNEPTTSLFSIFERHTSLFHSLDLRYIRPLVTPTQIKNHRHEDQAENEQQ